MILSQFKALPLMGIIRGISLDQVEPLIETVILSGLKTIEVTLNTENAFEIIRKMVSLSNQRLTIGAGTVLKRKDLHLAYDSGASFMVSPVVIPEVIEDCVKEKIPIFPGALTPNEIYEAWRLGASMIKLFPAQFFGHEYVKEIKGPFDEIELLICGGVTPQNIQSYLSVGAKAFAFGGSVFNRQLWESKQFDVIQKKIEALIFAWKNQMKSGV